VTADGNHATSFGNVAESYDRVRPGPPQAALDWLVPAGCAVAVDLAAGTGLFTRALLDRAARVVAVEPDPRMREVLARRTPGLDVRAGRGEALPLPDASADAVFVSTAWHWLDPVLAVPEIARVLRPGGRLGIIWTSRDRDDDWVAELDLVQLSAAVAGSPGTGGSADGDRPLPTAADVRAGLERHHAVALPPGAPFGPLETASFRFTRTMPVADVLEWLGSNSDFITASPAVQAATTARWRAALLSRARPGPSETAPSAAGPVVDLPSRSWCGRTDRR
jgi:SAM-dependent methyltransferase